MNIEKRLEAIVREIRSGSDTDPEWDVREQIGQIALKHGLDSEEVRFLCRKFGILTEDVRGA